MVNLASGTFHHCIKGPHWSLDRDSSLSNVNLQPFFGVGNKTNKVDGDLCVKQNNTILDYLYYFLQLISQREFEPAKRFWIHFTPSASKGTLILSPYNFVSSLFLQIKDFLSFLANSSPLFKNFFSTLVAFMFLSTEITKWPCLTFTKSFF